MIKDILLRIYWGPFRIIVQHLPPRLLYLTASLLAQILYLACKEKRAALEKELQLIPGIAASPDTRRTIIRESFRVFLSNELEMLCFPVMDSHNVKGFVTCENPEILAQSSQMESGTMLLFAHFGANQMIMPAIGYGGYKMNQISAPATVWKDKFPGREKSSLAKKMLEKRWEHERALPANHINVFQSLKQAFRCLRQNEFLGVAIDGGGGQTKVKVDFLGRKAMFSTGAVEIAMRTSCTVIPVFMIRTRKGTNRMILERPLRLAGGNAEDDTSAVNIRMFTELLEKYVVKYPAHYLNFLAFRRYMALHGDEPFFVE